MRRREPDVIGFRVEARQPVLDVMAELAGGGGWLVLQPGFDPDAAPRRWPTRGILQRRAVALAPLCTWVPGEREGGIEVVALGIEHAGRRAVGEEGVSVPQRWAVRQDDIRGLVVAVPRAEPHDVVLDWLVGAAAVLTVVPLTGEWRVVVHRTG